MDVTIIGTGNMARGIGTRALAGGHNVTVVGKDSEHAQEAVSAIQEAGRGGSVAAGVAGDAIDGDLVVLAVYYADARAAVEQYADQLSGKTVVDITNPVNETFDALVVPPDSSATQELAWLAPGARLVKAFNTTFAGTLEAGQVGGQPLDVLIAGDDDEAKAAVAALVRDCGLNPIDTGPQHRARELEALGLLHIGLQNTLGTGFGSAVKFLA
ncbi:MAG: NAD(P)-binding domain-containing protein [Thermoleophilaceae bacterium]|nr:NAD(P)-binding domain-containing protein [Thermoleophilaceae bacterium]